ncbi:hypothetical protein L2449_20560 [Mesorhizobium muleiense]|uniref:hypothetical protein n=1 Tax=Mesorhizobium muleiense TaxID=1004279 RepID=UPI001F3695B8|nr:hypothetical protein [Mesorhizobium muleiense]MCF6119244.1 hypothetical protein [Mesorhizobium muleiense]
MVIDSTIAASPATFFAMSAMTVKVVTALNFSCAFAGLETNAAAKTAAINPTTTNRPYLSIINISCRDLLAYRAGAVTPRLSHILQLRLICK